LVLTSMSAIERRSKSPVVVTCQLTVSPGGHRSAAGDGRVGTAGTRRERRASTG
jgi:hypothetical protein